MYYSVMVTPHRIQCNRPHHSLPLLRVCKFMAKALVGYTPDILGVAPGMKDVNKMDMAFPLR